MYITTTTINGYTAAAYVDKKPATKFVAEVPRNEPATWYQDGKDTIVLIGNRTGKEYGRVTKTTLRWK